MGDSLSVMNQQLHTTTTGTVIILRHIAIALLLHSQLVLLLSLRLQYHSPRGTQADIADSRTHCDIQGLVRMLANIIVTTTIPLR